MNKCFIDGKWKVEAAAGWVVSAATGEENL